VQKSEAKRMRNEGKQARETKNVKQNYAKETCLEAKQKMRCEIEHF